MAFDRAVTSLATLEEKLRRALGLAGVIGAKFDPTLTPVFIAGDLRDAGNASFRGRRWAFSFAVNIAAPNVVQAIRFDVDMIVHGLQIQTGAASVLNRIWITAPGDAPPVAVVNNAGTWVERRQSVDLVPLTHGGPGPLTGTAPVLTNMIWSCVGGAGISGPVAPLEMFLPAGSHLGFEFGAAGNTNINLWGTTADQA